MKKTKSKILLSVGVIATLVTTGSVILSCGSSSSNPNPKPQPPQPNPDQDELNGITTDMVKAAITKALAPTTSTPAPNAPTDNKFIVSINGVTDASIIIANWVKYSNFGYLTFSIVSITKGSATIDGAKFGTINIFGYKTTCTFSNTNISSEITCMIYTSDKKYMVGTKLDGLWVSNNGINFTQLPQQSEISITAGIISLFQASNAHIFVSDTNGLWKSVDGGVSFTNVKLVITSPWSVNSIYQTSNHDLYLGLSSDEPKSRGLWKSIDGGENFSHVLNIDVPEDQNYSIYQTSNGDIYVGTGTKGLWVFKKGGGNFTQVDSIGNIWIHSIYQTSNGNIYVATNYNGLWFSIDGGKSFVPRRDAQGNNWNVQAVYQVSNGDIFVGANVNGLWISKDDGVTFNRVDPVSSGIHTDWDINVLFQAPNVDKLFVGMDDTQGLWVTSEQVN